MAAKRGAATIEYGDGFVQVKLENHGTFRTPTEGFRLAAKHCNKRGLAADVAAIYAGHHEGYESQGYWRQYPVDVLRVIVADCYSLHIDRTVRNPSPVCKL